MNPKYSLLLFLFFILGTVLFLGCSSNDTKKKEPIEIKEVTGIVSGYEKDVMYFKVLRTSMVHQLRMTDQTKMDSFACPKDTVLLVYTGVVGYTLRLPEILEVKDIRPYNEIGSQVVNLNDLRNSGELKTRP